MEEPFEIADLRSLLESQREAEKEEYEENVSLEIGERCLRGYAIRELYLNESSPEGSLLTCSVNHSRFQQGDEILLSCGDFQVQSELIDVSEHSILVKAEGLVSDGPWTADRVYTDFTRLVDEALAVLQEGNLPLFDVLAGKHPVRTTGLGIDDAEGCLRDLEEECGYPLNTEQREAYLSAAELPQIWALQGPPGTGKTNVAVLIAEAFAREPDIRVLVVSLSHAAVDNLLSTIKSTFPSRCVAKVGRSQSAMPGVEWVPKRDFLRHRRTHSDAIYGMTTHSALTMASSNFLKDYHPEVVIVDEAGQVPLAVGAGLTAIGASLLLLGDQYQLSAIYPRALRAERLACSVLEWSARIRSHSCLSETHRLNAELAEKVGKVFYPDSSGRSGLISSIHAAGRRFCINHEVTGWLQVALDPSNSLVWIDTQETGTYQESEIEAEIVVSLLSAIGESGGQVVVLTPFRRQVNRIREYARGQGLVSMPIVDTVESVQGQSVDVSIVSLAASNVDYLQHIAQFYYQANRWCVAASRAKTKTIIVGSAAVVSSPPGSGNSEGFVKLVNLRQLCTQADFSKGV